MALDCRNSFAFLTGKTFKPFLLFSLSLFLHILLRTTWLDYKTLLVRTVFIFYHCHLNNIPILFTRKLHKLDKLQKKLSPCSKARHISLTSQVNDPPEKKSWDMSGISHANYGWNFVFSQVQHILNSLFSIL